MISKTSRVVRRRRTTASMLAQTISLNCSEFFVTDLAVNKRKYETINEPPKQTFFRVKRVFRARRVLRGAIYQREQNRPNTITALFCHIIAAEL